MIKSSKFKVQSSKYLLLAYGLLSPVTALAQTPNPAFETFPNPFPNESSAFGPDGGLISLFNNLLRLIFLIAGIYAFVNIVIAGFQFVNAQGDPKKIKSAWFKIWQSLVGLIVLVVSFIGAVILGAILFGDPGAILNITIFSAQ